MTPSVQQILMGVGASLAAPAPPEAAGDYMASKIGMIASMSMLAAQEADRAVPVRLAENAAIRALFRRAAGTSYDADLSGALSQAVDTPDDNLAVSALDRANAGLRRLLISLHTAVEAANDTALDHHILRLYAEMAAGRSLALGR